jgi:serine O-acetyltransferase
MAKKAKAPPRKRGKAGVPGPLLAVVAGELEHSIAGDHLADIWEVCRMPGRKNVARLLDQFLALLFPGAFGDAGVQEKRLTRYLRANLGAIRITLTDYATRALDFEKRRTFGAKVDCGDNRDRAAVAVDSLLRALPGVRGLLGHDLQAAYEGDPAATSVAEVMLSYPFVQAIAALRIAHELYRHEIPFLPRMLSEVAHSRTGVDIHPGAQIGPGFFIDHGTGVVIGETAVLGRGVKLYQGVTLGALSFPKDADGNPVKGIKRHPNIEDGVTIYAGATVLGGDTTIGKNSVIGGNCWITSSVPPDTLVLSERTRQRHRN